MEITEEWALEMGGWQVYKEARNLWKTGVVTIDKVGGEPDISMIKGSVLGGGKSLGVMLKIVSRTDVTGVCSCRESRMGILCRHALSLAVALANGESASQKALEPSVISEGCEKRKNKPQISFGVLFAKNMYPGLRRGKLAIEISESSGPICEADKRLGEWLAENSMENLPVMAALDGAQTDGFLKAVGGHPRCQLRGGGDEKIEISSIPLRLPVECRAVGSGADALIGLQCPARYTFEGKYLRSENRLFPLVGPTPSFQVEWARLLSGEVIKKPLPWLLASLQTIQSFCDLSDANGSEFLEHLHIVPEEPEFFVTLEGSLTNLTATFRCSYPISGVKITPCAELSTEMAKAFPAAKENGDGRYFTRNLRAEIVAIDRLEDIGFQRSIRGEGEWVLSGEREVIRFFGSELPRLERDWTVRCGERFSHATRSFARIGPVADFGVGRLRQQQRGGDWLTFSVNFVGEDGHRVPAAEIQRMLRGGGSETVKLPNGQRGILDRLACEESNEFLSDCDPDQIDGKYRLDRKFLGYLEGSITSHNTTEDGGGAFEEKDKVTILDIMNSNETICGIMRGYQSEGARWLADRILLAGGALLADEMGLGKTLQTLALISYWKKKFAEPALVVCPKSLLENWKAEAEKFASHLKTTIIRGTPEQRGDLLTSNADLFITGYGSLVQDSSEFYKGLKFGLVVLDEAGAIKNPKTRASKAARSLKADGRIALTGTPLENSVRDLWSIMEFAIPGYLGPIAQFESRYIKPIQEAGKPPKEIMKRLRSRIAPYVLRRTKAQVVAELPRKIEKTVFCELTIEQESVYRRILDAAHSEIDEAKKRGGGAAKIAMFTALLRLRQTCCDLRVLPDGIGAQKLTGDQSSGKLAAFKNEVSDISESGGKMLCFSQFVGVLRLLREELDSKGIGYCYLDGQTENRGAAVDDFQGASSSEKPVFLISLKAGGYGLNLTAANHVALYDPWWNPAVESQAIDRAHRIGQESVVTCSRYIARGTVEEKILLLQKKKREVIDAALDDDQPTMSALSTQDLEALLE